jgi:hypothetical protein
MMELLLCVEYDDFLMFQEQVPVALSNYPYPPYLVHPHISLFVMCGNFR